MDWDGVKIHEHAKKRGLGPVILTQQAWSIKYLLYMGKERCFFVGQRLFSSGQGSAILPARVANQSTGFDSFCTLAGKYNKIA